MIEGVISAKEVLLNGGSIARGFGLRSYLRCLLALFSRRRTTFLEVVWDSQAAQVACLTSAAQRGGV